jgi:hypothetical protein
MNKNNIHQLHLIKQDTREGIFTMKGISLTNLLHTLIREYGTYHDGSYCIDPTNLSFSDKKLVLSHVTDSQEYEWASVNPTRTEAVFQEYIKHIQTLFDSECDEVYREDMEEYGMVGKNCSDNGEVYWVRR